MDEARRLIVVGASWFGADDLIASNFSTSSSKRVKTARRCRSARDLGGGGGDEPGAERADAR